MQESQAQSLSTPRLDSTFLLAFELAHNALKQGARESCSLSIAQYRILIKLLGAHPEPFAQKDLGRELELKPNVITQALDALERAGFAKRARTTGMRGRASTGVITESGINAIERANDAIVAELYKQFPSDSEEFRTILKAAIMAGSAIDPNVSQNVSKRFFASRTLVSCELLRSKMESELSLNPGATYSECRILQRIGEVELPLRISDISKQLSLTATTAVRAVDRLVARGWIMRLAAPNDRKSVYVRETEAGADAAKAISHEVDAVASEYLWKNLSPERSHDIAEVGHVVIASLQKRDEQERLDALRALKPIEG